MDVTPYFSMSFHSVPINTIPSIRHTVPPFTMSDWYLLIPNEWLRGIGIISTLPFFMAVPSMTLPAIPTSPLWCMTTPFEDPVVPVVKSSIDLSSSPGSSSSASLSSFILVIISFWLIHFIPSTGLSDMRHAASTLWPISTALSADVDFSIGTTSTFMYCSAVNTVR